MFIFVHMFVLIQFGMTTVACAVMGVRQQVMLHGKLMYAIIPFMLIG
jgi:ribonuclease PH